MSDLLAKIFQELLMGDINDAGNLIKTAIKFENPITKYIQFMQQSFGLIGFIIAWPLLALAIYLVIWLIFQIWELIKYWAS